MNTAEDQGQLEKAKAEELLASVPRPDEIDDSITIDVDNDWSGDPALYLTFLLRPDADPDDAFFQRFSDFSNKVQRKILDSGISRFPYVRLRNAA